MPIAWRRHRSLAGGAFLLTLLALGPGVGATGASGPPAIGGVWASQVSSSTARLSAQINPNGLATTYHFDYITKAAYDANGGTFAGASRSPAASDASAGSGSVAVTVQQILSNLSPDTAYRYRVVAKNITTTTGTVFAFTTQSGGGGEDTCPNKPVRAQQNSNLLPDCRGYEMVSPVDKNGGEVEAPGAVAGGGVLQAAAGGGAVTYGSQASFGAGAQGAAPASQYVATRGSGGWSSENITAPLFSDTYNASDEGAPYQLFSADLARGLLLNGDHCRGGGGGCAVANPPLAGTDAPAGYQNYYLREGVGFSALLGSLNAGYLDLGPADFDLRLAGASADLTHVVVSTCAKLTAEATEVAVGSGCDPAQQNLYEWSSGTGLSLINLLPGQFQGNHHGVLAAQSGAVSPGGARVYWREPGGNLYLRESGDTKQVDADAGGGGTFETASADGAVAFFTVGGHLWRYDDGSGHATDLTSGGVAGVLGASDGGDYVYYQDGNGLQQWHSGTITEVAPGAGATGSSDYPPTAGTARVSADGTHLLFVSSAYLLVGYDNTDLASPALCGQPTGICDSEVYLYDATGAGTLTCVSCNPTNGRPIGPSSIPGAIANGTAPGSTNSYKPRALSADGKRVFFDSRDALAPTDTNSDADVYQWEAQGEGNCARPSGCVGLISSGRGQDGASFADASADGSDALFLTGESLIRDSAGNDLDPGSVDLYDARAGGGFLVPSPPIICEGDSCPVLPPEPVDPTLTTLQPGPGNPPVRYHNLNGQKKKKRHKKHHKARHHKRHHGSRR
jgi:hypothetical protein